MRIISNGRRPDEEKHRATCRNCSCLFEFARQEAFMVPDQRDGNYLTVSCPDCGMQVTKALNK